MERWGGRRMEGGVERWGDRRWEGRLDRRVVLKAMAGIAAMSLGGVGVGRGAVAAGPGMPKTIAGEWREAEAVAEAGSELAVAEAEVAVAEQGVGEQGGREDGALRPRRRFRAEFPFYAVAPHWGGEAAAGATVELRLSADGEAWSDPIRVRQSDAEGGRPERNNRRFGQLVATEGASFVAYQTLDADGEPTTLPDLGFTYIDASPGPTLATLPAPVAASALAPPPIVSRQQWGADEALRFGPEGEIWPVAYAPIEHLIVHHTDTANFQDPLVAIRTIYFYHAVARGWGDIGYNYLVDYLGNVYEGRVGGEGAVGGHAAGYNEGTVGIGTIGRFDFEAATPEAQSGLVWITAWAGRSLDPFGAGPFGEVASLPTICAHRDVNATACPGDALYGGLAALRDYVDVVLGGGSSPQPGPAAPSFFLGQGVVTTGPETAVYGGASTGAAVVARLGVGAALIVADGPATVEGVDWYAVQGAGVYGWTPAVGLAPSVDGPIVGGDAAGTGGEVAAFGGGPPPSGAGSGGPFAAGTTVRVVDGALNLHAEPGLGSAVVGVVADGTPLTVVEGPTAADGYEWYRVASESGGGWCVAPFLVAV